MSLSAGTTYFYRVRATNSAGSSAPSNIASATTAALTTPTAPGNLTVTPMAKNKVKVAWTDYSSNESGFILERSTSSSGWSTIATLAANTTSYINSGLTKGTTYSYRVSAFNTAGSSAYAAASLAMGDSIASDAMAPFSNGPQIADLNELSHRDKDLLLA
jgi:predicted phage tail protein